jgi:tetratricopeptide (TPR) repeat protein
MPEDHEFIERMRRWYERPTEAAFGPCEQGPRFADLVESVRLGLPLEPADQAHVEHCPRCRRTLETIQRLSRAASEPEGRSAPPVIRRRWAVLGRAGAEARRRWSALAGLATAAAVGMALLWMFVDSGSRRVEASWSLREVGFAAPLVGALAAPSDPLPADAGEWDARIEAYRAARDEALAAGDGALAAGEDRQEPWMPWVQIYRNLFAAGRFDEARAELDAFVDYGRRENETRPDGYSMYYSALFERGEMHAALGDMESAWKWHLESLAVRRDFIEEALLRAAHPEARLHRRESAEAATIFPSLAALSMLAAAGRDLPLALDYHRQAEQKLTAFFVAECRDQGVAVPRGGTLVDMCLGVVPNADDGSYSLIVKVREHLLGDALLHRLNRDLAAAERSLDDSRRIEEALDEHRRSWDALHPGEPFPDPAAADESRLDFNEPMERLRIAIAREDFAAAVRFAALAARNSGPRTFAAPPTGASGTPLAHAPIGVLARAELDFLHGVALAGLCPRDPADQDAPVHPEALRLLDSALDTIDRLAASLPERERGRFLSSFHDWRGVRNRIIASVTSRNCCIFQSRDREGADADAGHKDRFLTVAALPEKACVPRSRSDPTPRVKDEGADADAGREDRFLTVAALPEKGRVPRSRCRRRAVTLYSASARSASAVWRRARGRPAR